MLMGTWGSGLYANDTTCDVKDAYLKFLQEGYANIDAFEKTLEKLHELIGDQDEPLLWFALAETQWSVGRLLPEVKEKALEWIKKYGGLELWLESAKKGAGWKMTLHNLKEKLESPMPPEKTIRKPEEIDLNLWNINDIYAYQFYWRLSKEHGYFGKYMILQKIGEGKYNQRGKTMMRIQIIDKVFNELPTLDDLDDVRILPVDFPTRNNISKDSFMGNSSYIRKKDPIWMSAIMNMFKVSEYPAKHLTFIGNKQGPLNTMENNRELTWGDIDTWLYEFYELWRGIEYETLSEGIFEYIQR
jgi:hypothetical protein